MTLTFFIFSCVRIMTIALGLKVKARGQCQTLKVKVKSRNAHDAKLPLPRSTADGIRRYGGGLGLWLGTPFETRSAGPRSSIENSFLVYILIVWFHGGATVAVNQRRGFFMLCRAPLGV